MGGSRFNVFIVTDTFKIVKKMIDKKQLRRLIKETLREIELYSPAAENLVYGTISAESKRGTFLWQLNGGPALGICQMEPGTHDDIWRNYLKYHKELSAKLMRIGSGVDHKSLLYNLKYAIAMCRVNYRRFHEPLPAASDIKGLADYWKRYYNTFLGKGRTEEFIEAYKA